MSATDSPLPPLHATRPCRGHWHVTAFGDDVAGLPDYSTDAEAQAAADRLNAAALPMPWTNAAGECKACDGDGQPCAICTPGSVPTSQEEHARLLADRDRLDWLEVAVPGGEFRRRCAALALPAGQWDFSIRDLIDAARTVVLPSDDSETETHE